LSDQHKMVAADPLRHFVAAHFRIAANILFCEYKARGAYEASVRYFWSIAQSVLCCFELIFHHYLR
jgi:hypothetical protein